MRNLKLLTIVTATLLQICSSANAEQTATLSAAQQATLTQALDRATFANSPPTTSSATFAGDSNVPQITPFSYTPGTPLVRAIPGSVAALMGAGQYSPVTATAAAGDDPSSLSNTNLSALPFVTKLPFAAVIFANPEIAKLKVKDVFPTWAAANPDSSLGDTANSPLGKLPLPADVAASTPISPELASLTTTPYSDYPGIGKPDLPETPSNSPSADPVGSDGVKVGDLPGIPKLPWSKFIRINGIPSTMALMKVDKLHTGQKALNIDNGDKIAAGSNKEPNAPCQNCDAIELLSVIEPGNNLNPLNGSLSPIGLKLKGGEGIVGDVMTAAGIREPAGFEVPYIGMNGCGSKWSAESPNAQDGTIQQTLNFRFCYHIPFIGFQASPYFIPLPLPLPANEQQANLLLPMKITPVVGINTATLGAVPSAKPSAKPPAFVRTEIASVPGISPTIAGENKVALFGSATKKAYSPLLNLSGDV